MLLMMLWIIVQIVLESLPVSSSGHVALLMKILQKLGLDTNVDHMWVVDFLLHGPTIFILLIFFFKDWWKLIFKQKVDWSILLTLSAWQQVSRALLFVGVADSITFLFWWLNVLPSMSLTIGFCITALLLYISYYFDDTQRLFNWSSLYAVLLGVVQGLSLLPGISRFASTYLIGKCLGYTNKISFMVSFMVQLPLIVGGFAKGLYVLRKETTIFTYIFDFKILFAILSASIVSFVMLWFVEKVIQRKKLWCFSLYMIVPILLTLLV